MKQIVHIFAKDSRRFWLEILISLAVTVAFVRVYPVQWQVPNFALDGPDGMLGHQGLQMLSGLLTALLPLTWWVLVGRVVMAERLVGDTQFWVTRPYVWWKLLSAKVLFLLVYVSAPFLISQWAILTEAGFDARHSAGGVLLSVVAMMAVVVMPLMALAAVIKSFVRMVLVVLGLVVALVVIAYFAFGIGVMGGSVGGGAWPWFAFLVACGMAIVWQYWRRRVWVARGLMIGLPLVALGVVMALPTRSDLDAVYARGNETAPVRIAFTPGANHSWSRSDNEREHKLGFNLPITVSGLDAGKGAMLDKVKWTVEAADGTTWNSSWDEAPGLRFLPGDTASQVNLMMPEDLYRRFAVQPVTLHVEFAVTMLYASKVTQVALPAREYAVEGFGICSAGPYMPNGISNFQCRTAMHAPPLTYVSMTDTPMACDTGARGDKQITSGTWVGVLDPSSVNFGLAPVETEAVGLTYDVPQGTAPIYVCVGQPVTFTRYAVERRTRTELTVTGFRLPTERDPGSL
jgi:hypothetical protein